MRLAALSAAFVLLLIPGQSSSLEAFCCYGKGAVDPRASYVHRVANFGDDPRRTMEEYAQDKSLPVSAVKKRFEATGTITCPSQEPCDDNPARTCPTIHEASAQLTLRPDVITTSAHLLADLGSCKIVGRADECTFQIEGSSRVRSVKVAKLLDIGDPLGKPGNHCPVKEAYRGDWAVMKLSQPVPEVTPYMVDLSGKHFQEGDSLQVVCHSVDFTRPDRKGTTTQPKYIESCSVVHAIYRFWIDIIQTDCASSHACSGGSLLTGEGDKLTLRAVTRSGFDLKDIRRHLAEGWNPKPSDAWMSEFVPVSRDFLNALRKLEGLPPLVLSTKWDERPQQPVDLKSLGRVPTMKELNIKQVGPSDGH